MGSLQCQIGGDAVEGRGAERVLKDLRPAELRKCSCVWGWVGKGGNEAGLDGFVPVSEF